MPDAAWQASSTYLTAFIASLRHLNQFEKVHAAVEPDARAMLDNPRSQRWWSGPVFASVMVTHESVFSRAELTKCHVHASHSRMGPLVKPLASVLLALARSPADSLMQRLPTFMEAGVQGVEGVYTARDDGHGGHVRFIFPTPVPEALSTVWHGLFDFGFTLAKAGRVVSERLEPTVHHYEVTW